MKDVNGFDERNVPEETPKNWRTWQVNNRPVVYSHPTAAGRNARKKREVCELLDEAEGIEDELREVWDE